MLCSFLLFLLFLSMLSMLSSFPRLPPPRLRSLFSHLQASPTEPATFTTSPAGSLVETIIKKSRFIAHTEHHSNYPSVQSRITTLRKLHPKASHVCWAYIGATPATARSSDDGEPTGTAGAPILTSLQREALCNTAVFVVRYFGGECWRRGAERHRSCEREAM